MRRIQCRLFTLRPPHSASYSTIQHTLHRLDPTDPRNIAKKSEGTLLSENAATDAALLLKVGHQVKNVDRNCIHTVPSPLRASSRRKSSSRNGTGCSKISYQLSGRVLGKRSMLKMSVWGVTRRTSRMLLLNLL
jgi:hypothetical protein